MSRPISERLVELLDPSPGETVLELAAGSGDTGFLAAARIGPEGRLISSDIAPGMVEAARGRASELGLTNVEFRVLDAQGLDLADESVDSALCRWGYMLFPDPVAALAETRRVLRPGGRVALAVWAESEHNPWGAATGRALVALGFVEEPDADAPGPFRLGAENRLLGAVRDAGLEPARVEEIPVTWRPASFDGWWATQADLSRMLSSTLAELGPEDAERARSAVHARLEEFEDDSGALVLPGLCRVVLATKPL